jgi:hypothetical protein
MVFQRDFGAKRRAARVHSVGIVSFDPSVRRLLDSNETWDEMSLLVQQADVRVSCVVPYQGFTHARMAVLLAGTKSATDRCVVVRMIFSTASIFTTRRRTSGGRPGRTAVLESLWGLTDEAAARSLGMSVRTYRRHVASLLQAIDCESRFQAGVKAAHLGLIPGPMPGQEVALVSAHGRFIRFTAEQADTILARAD